MVVDLAAVAGCDQLAKEIAVERHQTSIGAPEIAMAVADADVPDIDVSSLFGSDREAKHRVAHAIHDACRGSGFFYASHHGIDLAELHDVVTRFHQRISAIEKWQLAIHAYNSSNTHIRNGYYLPITGRKAVESYCYLNPEFTPAHPMIVAGRPMHEVNLWPDASNHPGFREYCEGHYRKMCRVASALLRGFGMALGQTEDFFESSFDETNTLSSVSFIRYPFLEHYPPVKVASDGTRLSFEHHLDVSLITILHQTCIRNLQVETPEGYRNIRTSPDSLLVNCGTYMAHVTNGYFPAPRHRVLFVNRERLSLPFFVNLGYHSLIAPFWPNEPSRADGNAPLCYGEYLEDGLKQLILSNGQT